MNIRTPLDLGLVIRDRRRKLKLSQADLASKAGVGRQWVVGVEGGRPGAELGLILRTLTVLDLSFGVNADDHPRSAGTGDPSVDSAAASALIDRPSAARGPSGGSAAATVRRARPDRPEPVAGSHIRDGHGSSADVARPGDRIARMDIDAVVNAARRRRK